MLLEQLTGLQLVKKLPAFHRTRRFITALTKRPTPISILGQHNPVHIPTSHLLEIHHSITYPSTPSSLQWTLCLRLPHQYPIHTLSSPIRATYPAHLILLNFITRTILGEEYKYLYNLPLIKFCCVNDIALYIKYNVIIGRTNLEEWSTPTRDLYMTTHSTHNWQSDGPVGIRTRNNSRRKAADPQIWPGARSFTVTQKKHHLKQTRPYGVTIFVRSTVLATVTVCITGTEDNTEKHNTYWD